MSLSAQKDVTARIITVTGDTLTGTYSTDPSQTNLHRITLLSGSHSSSSSIIEPAQAKKVYLGKEYLEPVYVYSGTDSQQVFLRRIAYGYFTLFEGSDEKGTRLYYLKLRNKKILLIPPDDHISFLRQHFTGCSSVKPERTFYDAVSLSNLIYKYGPCVEPGRYTRTRTKYNIRFSTGISAGYNLSSLHFANDTYGYPTDNFDMGGGSDLAFLLVMNFRRLLEFETGVGYTNISGYLDDEGMLIDVSRSDIYVPFLFRIIPRLRGSLRPFAEAGIIPMFLAGNHTTITLPGSEKNTIDPGTSRVSFTGGAGLSYLAGKHQFRLKFNYLNTHYLFSRKGALLDTYMDGSSYVFTLAYLFRMSD